MGTTPQGKADPGNGPTARRWAFGSAVLDERTLELTVQDILVPLERKPLEVLRLLLRRSGEVVTKEDFFEAIWPGRFVTEQVLTQCVSKLREALGDNQHTIIKTVRGYGFRLVARVGSGDAVTTVPVSARLPETRFAQVGEDRVAYQLLGAGPRDVVFTPGFWSHLEIPWEDPGASAFFRRLASFSRLIRFDRRGSGLSDDPSDDGRSVIEHWIDDCVAVLDAAGSSSAVIISLSASPVDLQFIDRCPGRCSGLVLINGSACWSRRPDYPEGLSPEAIDGIKEFFAQTWGRAELGGRHVPSQAGNAPFMQWHAKYERAMAAPRAVADNLGLIAQFDCRPALPRIRMPVLVMARRDLQYLTQAQARLVAAKVPGATFVELPGSDPFPYWETPDLILDLIEKFMTTAGLQTDPPATSAANRPA